METFILLLFIVGFIFLLLKKDKKAEDKAVTSEVDIAAVEALTIPGRPVKIAAIKPIMTAVCKLKIGLTPATNAKATASGIKASATVIPDSASFLKNFLFLLNKFKR
jgi:hypothetical protein